MAFDICKRTDRQSDTHVDRNTLHPYWRRSDKCPIFIVAQCGNASTRPKRAADRSLPNSLECTSVSACGLQVMIIIVTERRTARLVDRRHTVHGLLWSPARQRTWIGRFVTQHLITALQQTSRLIHVFRRLTRPTGEKSCCRRRWCGCGCSRRAVGQHIKDADQSAY